MPFCLTCLAVLLRNRGDCHEEAGASVGKVERFDRAVVRIDDGLHDGKPEPRTSRTAVARRVASIEAVEQKLRVGVAQAAAVVAHGEHRVASRSHELDGDVPARLDEAARIFHQVEYDLLQSVAVAEHVGCLAYDLAVCLPLAQKRRKGVHHFACHLPQIDARELGRDVAAFQPLQREQVVHQVRKAAALLHDDARELLAHRGRQVGVRQHLGVPPNRGERGAQLVCHIAHKRALATFARGEAFLLRPDGLGKPVHAHSKPIDFLDAPIDGNSRWCGVSRAEIAKVRSQVGERFGEKMPNEQAESKREHSDGHQKEKRQGPQSEREMRDRDCEGRRKDGEQRCEKREICLQLLYFLNLYP